MNAPNGPIEFILQGLEAHSAHLSKEELRAELTEQGVDVEGLLKKSRALVQLKLKAKRNAWMAKADQMKAGWDAVASKVTSWATRSDEEIRAAFAALQGGRTAVAFRKQGELSVADMASILDKTEELKARQDLTEQ